MAVLVYRPNYFYYLKKFWHDYSSKGFKYIYKINFLIYIIEFKIKKKEYIYINIYLNN